MHLLQPQKNFAEWSSKVALVADKGSLYGKLGGTAAACTDITGITPNYGTNGVCDHQSPLPTHTPAPKHASVDCWNLDYKWNHLTGAWKKIGTIDQTFCDLSLASSQAPGSNLWGAVACGMNSQWRSSWRTPPVEGSPHWSRAKTLLPK